MDLLIESCVYFYLIKISDQCEMKEEKHARKWDEIWGRSRYEVDEEEVDYHGLK